MRKKAKTYFEKDANLRALKNRCVSVIGYGSQGRAWALNLRDSGVCVAIGLPERSKSRRRARADEFTVSSNTEAARQADVIVMAAPDMRQPEIFAHDLQPVLRREQTLVFLHGFCIHAKLIQPPKDMDVVLVAPAGPGDALRETFVAGNGLPGLLAIHHNATGRAKETVLALAKAIGLTRAGVVETTFREETETDLFAEQVVLCGGMSALATAAFETLVAKGYQPEMAYLACVHELRALAALMQQHGIHGMRERISDTAKYGDLTRGPRVVDAHTRQNLKKILDEIRSGAFANEWIRENRTGQKRYRKLLERSRRHPVEKAGAAIRSPQQRRGGKTA